MTARDTVAKRIRSIQSANHERITLLNVLEFLDGDKPGLRAEGREAELHKEFAELQRADAGTVGAEWFDAGEPLVSFLKTLPALPEDLKRHTSAL